MIAFSALIEQDQRRTEAVLRLAGFEESPADAPRSFEDFHALAMLVASALRQSSFRFSPAEMAHAWEGAVNPEDADWKRALGPVSRSLFEVASTLCPNLSQWHSIIVAACVERSVNGLSAAPHYIEWVLNPIRASGESARFQDWFTQPGTR